VTRQHLLLPQPLRKQGQQAQLNVLELCSGAGGLSFLAHYQELWAALVTRWAVDYDFDCCATYKLNHPGAKVHWMGLDPFLLLCRAWLVLKEEVGPAATGRVVHSDACGSVLAKCTALLQWQRSGALSCGGTTSPVSGRCGTPCACCTAPQVLAWQLTEQEEVEGWAWPCSLQEARRLPQARQVDPSRSYEEQGMCKVGRCSWL
jgi:hypothetical protein